MRSVVASVCLVAAAASAAAPSRGRGDGIAATQSFVSNTAFRTTTNGSIVGAQDGNLLNVRLPSSGAFALVGILYGQCPFTACTNQTEGACGFGMGSLRVWTSPDLSQSSWSLLPGEILPPATRPQGIYFRPHVLYNAATGKYVLWVRWLDVLGPALSDDPTLYLTATANAVDGPYTIVNVNVTMYWNNSADDSLFADDDGSAYIAHTCRSCGTHIVVERLTADWTACAGATDPGARSALIGPGGTEAPALFKVSGRYYVTMTPLCCFCTSGAETLVFTAAHPLGPYTQLPSLGNAPGAQQNFVFVHPDVGAVLWSGNRWGSDPAPPGGTPLFDRSLQYWYPLSVAENGTIAPIVWIDNFTMPVAVG